MNCESSQAKGPDQDDSPESAAEPHTDGATRLLAGNLSGEYGGTKHKEVFCASFCFVTALSLHRIDREWRITGG